jgi:nucleoside recognition membrane protein YjiH
MSDWLTTPETTSTFNHAVESISITTPEVLSMVIICVLFSGAVIWFRCKTIRSRQRQLV